MWFNKKQKQQPEQQQPKRLTEEEDWAAHYAAQRARQEAEDREYEESQRKFEEQLAAERAEQEAREADPNYRSPTALYIPPRPDEVFSAENVSSLIREAFSVKVIATRRAASGTGFLGITDDRFARWPEGAADEVCARLVACVPSIVAAMLNEMHEAARRVETPQAGFFDVNEGGTKTFYS
ncbi:hypothetical protein LGM35_06440 [Burkholderia cenocepacia]|uniref:hypothetical protein n=1 Tax=Burkholderia cenocepacia TaxID=95486 RepID=UPI001CF479B8|nr:hypothetical protein [Burkholderia cenocepacia]MCA7922119.1 hypothetical protein [Burkholderia cenocepacia]